MFGTNKMKAAIDAANVVTDTKPVLQTTQPEPQHSWPLPQPASFSASTQPAFGNEPRRREFFSRPTHHDTPRTPLTYPESQTAQAIERLHTTMWLDQMRRNLEDHRRRKEEQERELNRAGSPNGDTIRFWVRTARHLPTASLNSILAFTRASSSLTQIGATEFVFPQDAYQVWDQIQHFETENQCRRYIKFIKDELEMLIDTSHNLTQKQKEQFHNALNTHDQKQAARIVSLLLGALIFATIAPTCLALAVQGKAASCLATSLLCITLTAAPYLFIEKVLPSGKYFPKDKGAACEVGAFQAWIQSLATLVETINPHIAQVSRRADQEIPTGIPVHGTAAGYATVCAPPPLPSDLPSSDGARLKCSL